jgi:hypothetical protein
MAILCKHPQGLRVPVLSRHVVGRSHLADLRITEPTVSGEHAVLRWTGRLWELHDLASRNGTMVDGKRLAPGERVALTRGTVIAFGEADNAWQLIDDAPPTLLAMPEDGDPLSAHNDLLALPSDDDPAVVAYRDGRGEWLVEHGGETSRITDRSTVRAGGHEYVLRIPELMAATWDVRTPAPQLGELIWRFSVSRDEEYIAVTARGEHHDIDLGARAHHAVMLTLARSRLDDRKAAAASEPRGLPESAEGWVYQDELATKLAIDETHLNVAVFRCRRQLAEAGIVGAASIIERRRPTREVRLGVARIEIVTV